MAARDEEEPATLATVTDPLLEIKETLVMKEDKTLVSTSLNYIPDSILHMICAQTARSISFDPQQLETRLLLSILPLVSSRFHKVLCGPSIMWESLTVPNWADEYADPERRRARWQGLLEWLQPRGAAVRHIQQLPLAHERPATLLPLVPRLHTLSCTLRQCWGDLLAAALPYMAACSGLQTLHISLLHRHQPLPGLTPRLISFPPMRCLTELELVPPSSESGWGQVPTRVYLALEELVEAAPRLRKLALPWAPICGSLRALAALHLRHLRIDVELGRDTETQRGEHELACLRALSSLHTLQLRGCGALTYISFAGMRALTRLEFEWCTDAAHLEGLRSLLCLHRLQLHALVGTIQAALPRLATLQHLTHLEVRCPDGISARGDVLESLATLAPKLRHLRIHPVLLHRSNVLTSLCQLTALDFRDAHDWFPLSPLFERVSALMSLRELHVLHKHIEWPSCFVEQFVETLPLVCVYASQRIGGLLGTPERVNLFPDLETYRAEMFLEG